MFPVAVDVFHVALRADVNAVDAVVLGVCVVVGAFAWCGNGVVGGRTFAVLCALRYHA